MKKILVIIGLAIWANMIFAQGTATISLNTIDDPTPETEITVTATLDALANPEGFPLPDLVSGFALYFYYDATVLELNGIIPQLAITMDTYWTSSGSTVVNMIPDAPMPGYNTIALVYATGGIVTGIGGTPIADVSFIYHGGSTDLIWDGIFLKGEDGGVKSQSYIVDYDGLDYDLSVVDGFAGATGPTGKTWTGAGDGTNWFDGANWNPVGFPTTEDVTINATGKAPMVVITGGAATTGMLTVASGAGINIQPSGSLTTAGLYTNDGELLISSDATGAAGAFIDNGGLTGGGTYEFDRYVSASLGEDADWHFISSPVDNSVSADLVGYWLKEWQPNNNMYVDLDPWAPCDYSMGTVALNPMQGYSVKENLNYEVDIITPTPCPDGLIHHPDYPAAQDNYIKFGGDEYAAGVAMTPSGWIWAPGATTMPALMANVNNLPSYSMNADWNGVAGNDLTGPFHQWNLFGNPYSAPIDNALFTAGFPTQVNASVYFFDGTTWQSYAGGVGPAQIPATQGFLVKVNAAGSWQVTVSSGMRTTSGAGMFYKSEVNDLLTLQASGNGFTDKTHVRFLEEANAGFDRSWDANKMFSTSTGVPQIYTTAGSEFMSINALPATDVVAMGFKSSTSGTYTIKAIETSEFSEVYLLDKDNGEVTDMLTGSYTFDYTVGDDANRFEIHFSPVGVGENLINSVSIWSSDNNIYVSVPKELEGTISVYNMMGQEVTSTDTQPGTNVIPMDKVNTYYVVKVLSNSNVITGKVYIK